MSTSNDILELETGVTADDPIILPSTPPSVSFEFARFPSDHAGVVKLEPDNDVDFHIPLMTSLFYQEEINWESSQQRRINQRVHRCGQLLIAIGRKADLEQQ
jgi:hypothetical protein